MKTKHKVFNLIILDESGSMSSIKREIISGFNEVVQTIREASMKFPDQIHYITFVTFNSSGINTILENKKADNLKPINKKKYKPHALTPLYDALGLSISKLKMKVEKEVKSTVLVTVLTDGLENASQEYNGKTIKLMIDELKSCGWTFTYIGADHDVEQFAASISITDSLTFNKSKQGIVNMIAREKDSRRNFYSRISKNKGKEDVSYFKEE